MKQVPNRESKSLGLGKTVAEKTVQLAAAISPAGVRDIRREQWQADLIGADEAGLSAGRLALGTLATAVFHRLTLTPPAHLRTLPARDRHLTAALISVSALSLICGFVSQRTVFYVWTSVTQHRIGLFVQLVLVFIIPLLMFLIAFLRVKASASRRIVAAMIFCTGSLAFLVGQSTTGPVMLLSLTTAGACFLATWAVAQRSKPLTWLLLVTPFLAIVSIGFAGAAAMAMFDTAGVLRSDIYETARLILTFSPIVAALIVGFVIPPRVRMRVGSIGTAA